MSEQLYRREAFQSKVKGFSNPVSIRGSLSATVLTLLLFAILSGLIAYGWAVPYTRKVTAPGFVAPGTGSIAISSPSGGVAQVLVANGETVERGTVLAVVADALDDAEEESLLRLRLDGLIERRALLDQRIALGEQRLENARRTYALRLENAERRRGAQERLLEMARRETALAEDARDRVASLLERGVSTETAASEADMVAIAAGQRLIDAETAGLEAAEALESLAVEREIELNMLEEELIGHRSERLALSSEITTLEAERERRVIAPIGGIVTFTKARNFERVAAGEPLFSIDPVGEDYVATVLAPSSAIGFVGPGDRISLRYEAYPFREHGVFEGHVTAIDNTAQLPQDIAAPIGGLDPVYRVYAEIDQAPVNKAGETLRLVSGMTFDASITADEKPILFWLLDPVL